MPVTCLTASGCGPPQPPQAPEITRDPGALRFCPDVADPAYSPRSGTRTASSGARRGAWSGGSVVAGMLTRTAIYVANPGLRSLVVVAVGRVVDVVITG